MLTDRSRNGVRSLLTFLFLGGLAATAAASTGVPTTTGHGVSTPLTSPSVFGVLYDQNNNGNSFGTSSQNFEAGFDAYDSFTADDFIVPAGAPWTVEEVTISGQYTIGPANSVNVTFYADAAGLPGAVVCDRPAVVPSSDVAGSFLIDFATPCVLAPGTYWMSAQVNMDFATGGQWYWNDRTVTSNSPAAWENPGGGFASPCTAWGQRGPTCGIDNGANDQMFTISGFQGCLGDYKVYPSTGAAIVPGAVDSGNHCDDCTTGIALPFSYTFYDNVYAAANVSSNGNLQFVSNASYLGSACLPDATLNDAIFAYQDDLMTTNAGEGIFTSTSGVAPNRIFNIEWRAHYFGRAGTNNWEIRLYEGQQRFDVIYGATADNGSGETVGVQEGTGTTNFTQYSCNTASEPAGTQLVFAMSCCGVAGPWLPGAAVPYGIVRYAFVQSSQQFYVISGVTTGGVITANMARYDATTNTWLPLAPIPNAGEAPAAGIWNGKIYVQGGGVTNQLNIYDIASDTWSSGAPAPVATYGAAGGAYNGKFYVAGGGGAGVGSNDLQIYDIASDTWSAGTPLPSAYLLGGATVVGSNLYMIGGFGPTPLGPGGLPGSSVRLRTGAPDAITANQTASMRLDMSTGAVTTGPAFTMQRGDFGLAYDGRKLYALGGDTTGGGFFDSSAEVDELDSTAWPGGTWVVSPPNLTFARQANMAGFFSTAMAGDEIWTTGGLGPGFTFEPTHEFRPVNRPFAVATGTATICAGASTPLTGSGGASCSWSPATGLDDPNSCTPIATPAVTTTYTLTVNDATGCASYNDASVTVTVNPLPTAVASGSAAICPGGSTPLSGSGGVSCSWSPATGLDNASSCTPIASPASTTTYTLTVTDANGCVSTNAPTVTVTVNPLPTAVASGSAAICPGGSTPLSGSGGVSCSWSPATGLDNASSCTPIASPASTTTYTLTVTDANGCVSTNAPTVTVTVNPNPTVTPATLPDGSVTTAYSQTVSGSGGTGPYTFAVTSGALPTGLSLNPSTGAITGTPTATGPFSFDITATDANGCTGTTSYTVNINAAGQILRFFTIQPCRLIDTRRVTGTWGGPPLQAATFRDFPLDGQCGIPADAVAVSANMTAVLPTAGGDLRAFPTGNPMPSSSVINFNAGGIRANNIIVPLFGTPIGSMTIRCDMPSGSTNFLFDANGYFAFVSQ